MMPAAHTLQRAVTSYNEMLECVRPTFLYLLRCTVSAPTAGQLAEVKVLELMLKRFRSNCE